jgi:hypothetical protein
MAHLAALDKDGDGDIDSSEWAAGYAALGAAAPGVPNPAVWYGTLPSGPSFSIEQTSMLKMYHAPSQLIEHADHRDEVPGICVGYAGHVPRARDKVGGAPLGHLPGTPVSPTGAVGIDMEAMMSGKFKRALPEGREKTFSQHTKSHPQYVTEAMSSSAWSFGATASTDTSKAAHQIGGGDDTGSFDSSDVGTTGIPKPKMYGEGIKVGYGGHKPGAKFAYGGSVHAEK